MGRATWFEADGTKRGEWTEEEDQKLIAYIEQYGIGEWRILPGKAGLRRCGKSCRLRWLNFLRPGIKKDKFTPQEEEDIIKFHSIIGNRWVAIAEQMPNRSDNDIKNHWNSCLKKRLRRNGIDPITHQPIIKTPSFNAQCGVSSSSSTISSSSTSSGSARLLNKIATGISSKQHDVDRIKNVLSDPRMKSINGDDQKEEEEEVLRKDHGKPVASDDHEEDFLMWDDDEMRRFMEETGVYNHNLDFSLSSYGADMTDQHDDHLL